MLRLTFPTVAANASPLAVLPGFVDVLGRKLDKIQAELDRWGLEVHVCCRVLNDEGRQKNSTLYLIEFPYSNRG